MQLKIELPDEVLLSLIADSLDEGFEHTEEYIAHLITGIVLETLGIDYSQVNESTPAPQPLEQWVVDAT